jgi:hypothetical protein
MYKIILDTSFRKTKTEQTQYMSIAIHELEASHQYEVSVDTFEDLVDFSGDLGRLLTGQVIELDSEVAAEIQELRDQVVDQVILTHEGEHAADTGYIFKVAEEPFVLNAIQLAKQKIEPKIAEPDSTYAWLSDPQNTRPVNTVPIKTDTPPPLFKD